jgi:hypothetical protein
MFIIPITINYNYWIVYILYTVLDRKEKRMLMDDG